MTMDRDPPSFVHRPSNRLALVEHQAERAVVCLFAALYTPDRSKMQACIEQAISRLGFDPDDEGELTLQTQAYIANGFCE